MTSGRAGTQGGDPQAESRTAAVAQGVLLEPGGHKPGGRLAKGTGVGKDACPSQVQRRPVGEAKATAQQAALGRCWGLGFRARLQLRVGSP